MNRRSFFGAFGTVAPYPGAIVAARGLEAALAAGQVGTVTPPGVAEIRLSSNENPLGPGRKALDAIVGKFPEAGRYPFNSTPSESDLAAAIAAKFRVKTDSIVVGAGSQEILKHSVRAWTTPARGLVTASPSFENCTATARRLGHPVVEIPVDREFRLDLEPMIAASKGAGLVFFNNPNNPTATVHGARAVEDFVARVHAASPSTVVLVDEAYHDYVTDPAYKSAVPMALATPNVVVARTFSKAYGMAGLRIGYAVGRPETVAALGRLKMPYNVSVPGIAAALAAIDDQAHLDAERARNTDVRAFTVKALSALGCTASASQANFLFVNVRGPVKAFREACATRGVAVARDFPPFEGSHARISLGTMTEMRTAVDVFRAVLEQKK